MKFFGLLRNFEIMSLPSVVKNIFLANNVRYNCDIFVHFYKIEKEQAGCLNLGGAPNTKSVYALSKVL